MADVYRIYSTGELKYIHCLSLLNKKFILAKDQRCYCFNCLKEFPSEEIKEWTDRGRTALCPKCGIDSVLPENSRYPITKPLLLQMNKFYFNIN